MLHQGCFNYENKTKNGPQNIHGPNKSLKKNKNAHNFNLEAYFDKTKNGPQTFTGET